MMAYKDILIGNNAELLFKHGDFVTGHSDGQDIQLLLLSEPGAWRQNPLAGIGIRKLWNGKNSALDLLKVRKIITQQLSEDGLKVYNVEISANGKITTDAERI